MSLYENLYENLGKDGVVVSIAFILGFLQVVKCLSFDGIMESPLSAICLILVFSLVYAGIAKVLVWMAPNGVKPLLSIILGMSIVYYLFFVTCDVDNDGDVVKMKITQPNGTCVTTCEGN
jgi:hypothetical protein